MYVLTTHDTWGCCHRAWCHKSC